MVVLLARGLRGIPRGCRVFASGIIAGIVLLFGIALLTRTGCPVFPGSDAAVFPGNDAPVFNGLSSSELVDTFNGLGDFSTGFTGLGLVLVF